MLVITTEQTTMRLLRAAVYNYTDSSSVYSSLICSQRNAKSKVLLTYTATKHALKEHMLMQVSLNYPFLCIYPSV